jgi:dihydroxy-acid dehydratase
MGTASSVAMMVEVLGLTISGTSTIPEGADERRTAAFDTGKAIVEMVNNETKPSQVLTDAAFRNAVRVLHASGGSTNAIIHLLAIAGRVCADLSIDSINELSEGLAVIADVEPSGANMIQDFNAAGGVPALMKKIESKLELDGRPLTEAKNPTIRDLNNPIFNLGAFAVVKGNLAPNGGLMKISAASKELFKHTGPAVVFNGYADMRSRIDDPNLNITKDSVLVLRDCGPVGVPGMPEWGMIPVPARLIAEGVTDMVRISDARMSGTSFGTCVLHVSPESAVGGPLGLVRDGDLIELNIDNHSLNLLVSEEELNNRKTQWHAPHSDHLRGWPALYRQHVLQADKGCDLDFLRPKDRSELRFIPPVVGRS